MKHRNRSHTAAVNLALLSIGAACLNPMALAQDSSKQSSSSSAQATQSIRASKLIGVSAQTKDGEKLGQLQDLIVNPKTGEVRFAILGQTTGTSAILVPVPWQAINVRSEREFTLNVDRKKLQSAPTLQQDRYSDMENPDYVIRIYRFYELEPVGGPGAIQSQSGQSRESSKPTDRQQ